MRWCDETKLVNHLPAVCVSEALSVSFHTRCVIIRMKSDDANIDLNKYQVDLMHTKISESKDRKRRIDV